MTALALLERLALEASESHGLSIQQSRALVRRAMVRVAFDVGVPMRPHLRVTRFGRRQRRASGGAVSALLQCPSCGNADGSSGSLRTFTYVEFVPRWQRVDLVNGRLIVAFEYSFSDGSDPGVSPLQPLRPPHRRSACRIARSARVRYRVSRYSFMNQMLVWTQAPDAMATANTSSGSRSGARYARRDPHCPTPPVEAGAGHAGRLEWDSRRDSTVGQHKTSRPAHSRIGLFSRVLL